MTQENESFPWFWDKKFNTDIFGDMGIGAMIVFIAMVLVAGIAASVIIQTANRLESQAMATGLETRGEVSSGIGVVDIEGHRSGSALNYLMISVRPRSASNAINLGTCYIEISDGNRKCVLTYLASEFHAKTEISGDMYQASFFDGLNATRFGVIVIEDADSSLSSTNPALTNGDQVRLTIDVSDCFGGGGLSSRTDVFGMVQPEEGCPGPFGFRTPFLNANTLYLVY
ncbi:MAG: flagellin [Candidatus Thermoplasmatota archaeon]|nr:flagellin [Candidatus Thermoplasmatota archaeon]